MHLAGTPAFASRPGRPRCDGGFILTTMHACPHTQSQASLLLLRRRSIMPELAVWPCLDGTLHHDGRRELPGLAAGR